MQRWHRGARARWGSGRHAAGTLCLRCQRCPPREARPHLAELRQWPRLRALRFSTRSHLLELLRGGGPRQVAHKECRSTRDLLRRLLERRARAAAAAGAGPTAPALAASLAAVSAATGGRQPAGIARLTVFADEDLATHELHVVVVGDRLLCARRGLELDQTPALGSAVRVANHGCRLDIAGSLHKLHTQIVTCRPKGCGT